MRFYDFGDDTYNVAFPMRLFLPDQGVVLSYGKPGAMVFVTTTENRCVFGTDGELAHSELRDKLVENEGIMMRGVLWPEYNVMTVWQTFDNVIEFRRLMKIAAGGLRDELGMNPDDILVYLGYMCPPSEPNRECDAFNVEMSVAEACTVGGNGSCNDVFHKLFLQDKQQKKMVKAKTNWSGMDNKNFWRHYEVVGEGKKRIVKLDESRIKEIIKRTLKKGMMNEAWMNLDGRRESTNVEDRRGEPVDYLAGISGALDNLFKIKMGAMIEGNMDFTQELQNDKQTLDAVRVLNGYYQKAQETMGSFKQKMGMQMQNIVPKIAKTIHTGFPIREGVEQGQPQRLSAYSMAYKGQFILAATQFANLVKNYIQAAQTGKMNPWKAFKTIDSEYKTIMSYSPIQQAQ